ncbi:MAG: hypothetical protein WDA01_09520 [Methanothrix sp.]
MTRRSWLFTSVLLSIGAGMRGGRVEGALDPCRARKTGGENRKGR